MNRLRPLLFLLLALPPLRAAAQEWGSVSGGLESNSVWSVDGSFRSNNYLKLDYVKGRFSAGIQGEYYPEPLLGYDLNLKGIGLPGKYIAWTEKNWSLTAGDFYDQFGSGILLRSWEDRDLGWNNSIGGGRFTWNSANELLSMKVLGGFTRRYLCYSSDRLAGAGLTLRPLEGFSLEGNAVVRHDGVTPAQGSWSVLSSYEAGGFNARAEWVGKPGGNAQLLELGYAAGHFSSALTMRRLDRMADPMGMNYLPSLCLEQTYALASLNPYTTFAAGELGGAADLFYRHGTWKFHANGSMIYALPSALQNHDVLRLAYRDINLEVEKRWNKRLKTVAFVSIQENSPTHGERKATNAQNAFVLDGVYKTARKLSLRMQLQYLYSRELTKDWMAALLEVSSTTGWSIHVQDLYNHGSTGEHYYDAGVSWTKGGLKLDLSYGHQRAGLVCSGGVCRWQPEYTGGMLRLVYQFATR
ncbi:MAG: hypothetical protein II851_04240 [Bacteroidales bacterium]|nr:hypothetical protein [Bacteroidales bacterium]